MVTKSATGSRGDAEGGRPGAAWWMSVFGEMAGNWRAAAARAGGAGVVEPADSGSVQYRPSGETLNSRGWTPTSLVELIGEPEVGCRLSTIGYAIDCAAFVIVA